MTHGKDLPQLCGSITVRGAESKHLISFIRGLGKSCILSADTASVVIYTEKCAVLNGEHYAIAYPYYKGFNKSAINCKKILTYAVEDDNADIVAKNVTLRNGFATFELLTPSGMGRVFVKESEKDEVRFMSAFACGLMLTGMPLAEIIALVSQK